MWGIICFISLIAAIAFLIMMFMAENGSTMKKVGVGMFVTSFILLLLSFVMWLKNRKTNVDTESSNLSENTD